ncbi:MAG: hypothetical protein HQL14_04720 [Candidatus Omnitrophica bacterium]|nr:hypothetical protein [Candidatus Omnitrophota bacterium]
MVFCMVCFGDPASPLTHGYNFAVLVLLGVTLAVLSAFAMMFLNFRQRAKNSLDKA